MLMLGLFALNVSLVRAEPADGVAMLVRLQQAAHQLDYAGVYIYQQGQIMRASRIAHRSDAQGERERVEVLDGMSRREFIRRNGELQSLFPDMRLILVEPSQAEHFPALFRGNVEALEQYYAVQVAPEAGRVAGRLCNIVQIQPRDVLRWHYRVCVDTETGLMLKAQTIDPEGGVLEQVAFSEVRIGGDIDLAMLETNYDTRGWKRVRTGEPIDLSADGWHVMAPAGFQPVRQVSRQLRHHQNVRQMVLSDGLAAMSVFIENADSAHADLGLGAARYGATNIYSRQLGEFRLTVLGEVPALTVREVAESITLEIRTP